MGSVTTVADDSTRSVALCSDSFVSISVTVSVSFVFSFVSPLLFVTVSTTSAFALSDSVKFLSLSWNIDIKIRL